MKSQYQHDSSSKKCCIIGSGSSLARAYMEQFPHISYISTRTSPKFKDEFEIFLSSNDAYSQVLVFSYIKGNLDSNIKLLEKINSWAEKNNHRMIYISTINASYERSSRYGGIKKYCENWVLAKKNWSVVRLGLVRSKNPFGPYKSLLSLTKIPFKLKFPEKSNLVFTEIESLKTIHELDLFPMHEIYDEFITINAFFSKKSNSKFSLDLSSSLSCLDKLNSIFNNKICGVFERLLTLSAIKIE